MKFSGCWTALITPFKEGFLDEPALRRLIRLQIRAGVSGLVPCGSTGEAATLSADEYRRVLSLCLEEAKGKVPVAAPPRPWRWLGPPRAWAPTG
jgi:4-hydroxy-tetrahydrodipicolinate synthase